MTRRLAAIAVADVVGYSRLMEADEAGTLATLKERRKTILEPVLREHGGRIVKLMGDGVLIEFASAVKAVEAALELQEKMADTNAEIPDEQHIALRIGINLGDVIGEGADIYGDGVNVAARLQTLAEPGGICVSRKVHDELRGKLAFKSESMGQVPLKNMSNPVEVHRISHVAPASHALARPGRGHDKPSVAVLPFVNMSGDAENEYLADGLTEDIITALSRSNNLAVTARTSVFTYKGRAFDMKRIARELDVGFLLEGSVRRFSDRVRVTAQLIDGGSGVHVWSEKFDSTMDRIFDIQDEIIRSVAACTMTTIISSIDRASRALDHVFSPAYRLALKAHSSYYEMTAASLERGAKLAEEALALEPELAFAHRMRAHVAVAGLGFRFVPYTEENCRRSILLAEEAARRAPLDDWCHWLLAWALAEDGRYEDALAACDTCLSLNPNHSICLGDKGDYLAMLGYHDNAIALCEQAIKLNPRDPTNFWYENAIAASHFFAGRDEQALDLSRRAGLKKPDFLRAPIIRAAAAGRLGRAADAQDAIERCLAMLPAMNLGNVMPKAIPAFARPADRERLLDGLRKAGLPE